MSAPHLANQTIVALAKQTISACCRHSLEDSRLLTDFETSGDIVGELVTALSFDANKSRDASG
jgi:hypothetical protein